MTTGNQFGNAIAKAGPNGPKPKPQGSATNGLPARSAASMNNPGFANPYAGTDYGAHDGVHAQMSGSAPKKKPPASTVDLKAIARLLGGPGSGTGTPAVPTIGIDQNMVDALHKGFDDQVGTINDLHDKQLAHLEQLHANGAAGVNKYGGDLQTALAGLAHDALTRGKAINGDIDRTYGQAHAGAAGAYKALANDIKSAGADGKGLDANFQGALQMLSNMHATQHADSVNQQGDLSQMLNDRRSEGHQMTTGSLDDMLQALQGAQYTADQQQTQQIGDARSSMDQGMVQAAGEAARENAAAKAAAAKGPKPPPLSDFLKATAGNDFSSAFDQVLHHDKHANQSRIANTYLSAISGDNPTMTPIQALQHWNSMPQKLRDANPMVKIALTAANVSSQNADHQRKAAAAYGATYYG